MIYTNPQLKSPLPAAGPPQTTNFLSINAYHVHKCSIPIYQIRPLGKVHLFPESVLVRRHLHSTDSAYKCLGYVLDILKVPTVTNEDVINAYTKKAHDFEDCLFAVCAASNKCDYIITRNKRGFEEFNIETLSPEELVSRL